MSFGAYPEMSLADARARRDVARADLAAGRDPMVAAEQRQQAAQAERATRGHRSFEAIAREWHAANVKRWTKIHGDEVIKSLEAHVFDFVPPTSPDPEPLGARLPDEIDASDVLAVCRAIEAIPAIEKARRVRQRMGAVFVHAISTQRAKNDPSIVIRSALAPLVKGRQPAVTNLEQVRQVLRDVEARPGHVVTRLAMRLMALTAVRGGRSARPHGPSLRNSSRGMSGSSRPSA